MQYADEGQTHILLSDKSKTELGRKLYIGAHRPFTVEGKGQFKSILGYYLWLNSGLESYRYFHGHLSIKDIAIAKYNSQIGDNTLYDVICKSIESDKALEDALKTNTLPLTFYEFVGSVQVASSSFEWYVRLVDKKAKS